MRGLPYYQLYVDASCFEHTAPRGVACVGAVLFTPEGQYCLESGVDIGPAKIDVAELKAILYGLKQAQKAGVQNLVIWSDSQDALLRLTDPKAGSNALRRHCIGEIQALARTFTSCGFGHIRGRENPAHRVVRSVKDMFYRTWREKQSWQKKMCHKVGRF